MLAFHLWFILKILSLTAKIILTIFGVVCLIIDWLIIINHAKNKRGATWKKK